MKQVFFETITPWHRPLVTWFLLRGVRVHVFDFTYRLKYMGWLRRLILEERVERIYTRFSRADGRAIDAAERLYPKLSGHPVLRSMDELFGAEESRPVFKSALAESLTRYFFMQIYFSNLPGKEGMILISESIHRWRPALKGWAQAETDGLRGVCHPRWLCRLFDFQAFFRKLFFYWPRYLAGWLYAVYAEIRAGRKPPAGEPAERFRCLYAVGSAFQMRRSGTRRFDFLLDHQRLNKGNTAFLLEVEEDGGWTQKTREEGYRVFRLSDYISLRSLLADPPRSVEWKKVRTALRHLARAFGAGEWMHEAALRGLQALVRESRFLERVRFDHYIYANQYGLVPRWRNVLLRRAGTQSWWFAYSTGGGFLYWENGVLQGDNDHGGRHHYWAYQNPDHFVSPCAPLIGYHREHRQRIGFYHDVGNLWSELILREEGRRNREELRRAWFGDQADGRKIVAWFDTTFTPEPDSPSTFAEAAQWSRDILRLAEEREDLLMVIKPSKDEEYYVSDRADQQWSSPRKGREVLEAWAALRAHPRVRLLSCREEPTPVVVGSDLTVTFCFSAVSAEALGAGKRGIWYEPGERWRKTYLGKEPLLTAHGYAELRQLVRKHLDGMGEEDHRQFLERSVRGPVDSFIDGRGLSRFQALIAQPTEEGNGNEAGSPPVLSVHR